MYFSIAHWRPIVNGFSGYEPPAYVEVKRRVKEELDEASARSTISETRRHPRRRAPVPVQDVAERSGCCAASGIRRRARPAATPGLRRRQGPVLGAAAVAPSAAPRRQRRRRTPTRRPRWTRSARPAILGVAQQRQPPVEPELVVDVVEVHLDRALGDEQALGDLPVAQPLRHHAHQVELARRERRLGRARSRGLDRALQEARLDVALAAGDRA